MDSNITQHHPIRGRLASCRSRPRTGQHLRPDARRRPGARGCPRLGLGHVQRAALPHYPRCPRTLGGSGTLGGDLLGNQVRNRVRAGRPRASSCRLRAPLASTQVAHDQALWVRERHAGSSNFMFSAPISWDGLGMAFLPVVVVWRLARGRSGRAYAGSWIQTSENSSFPDVG